MNIEVKPSEDTTFTTPVRLEGEHDFIVPAFLLISADTREQAEAKANELDEGINELLEMGEQSAIMVVDDGIPVEEWCDGSGDHDDAPTTLPIVSRMVDAIAGLLPHAEVERDALLDHENDGSHECGEFRVKADTAIKLSLSILKLFGRDYGDRPAECRDGEPSETSEGHLGILSEVEPLLHSYLSILRKLLEDNVTTVKVDIVKVEAAIKDIQAALEAQ